IERFRRAVEVVFDHSERVMRQVIASIPDGRYVACGAADNDGITDEPVPFEVAVEVSGEDIVIDLTNAPEQRPGPINCPLPTWAARACGGVMGFLGGGETARGVFSRPVVVRTSPGTIFAPRPPAPIFMYAWPPIHAIDHVHRALAEVVPERVAAQPGSDV